MLQAGLGVAPEQLPAGHRRTCGLRPRPARRPRRGPPGPRRRRLESLARSRSRPSAVVDLVLDLLGHLDVLVEEGLGVVAPLAEPLVAVGEERAGLRHDVVLDAQVDEAARGRDALTELDVELGLPERRRDLVLDDLDADAVADGLRALLQRLDPADVQALRRVELQRAAAGLGLGRPEHHADLLADLVREEADRLGAVEVARELAHRLAHHPRLQADGLVAHLALELGARRQRRHRVDGDEVDRAGAHEHVGDLQRLLAVVGLGDEQLVDVDADLLGVERVHRVLGVDEGADAAELLGLGDDVVHQRRLAGGLGAEDLDDPPARHPADAQREVEGQGAGGDGVDAHPRPRVAHAHDAALAELPFDLGQGALEGGVLGLRGLLLLGGGHLGRGVLSRLEAHMVRGGSDGKPRRARVPRAPRNVTPRVTSGTRSSGS